ncbi:winged helix-turn-helix transcriptional regulator [Clostridium saccharoperbutylacetonicum]|jgi:DNA-binding HxlR family transcriptional regulator|uniref:Transcriptional regulator, HxlR family n=1 Tax=Clostridium saccharoperbutylacetonicum N1-4(HMT) TaxID=931276 RepID=M1MH76_9CLOT|nr:helix-turn-helix domain-containing protein [Clostridium saccharoperbutylacetonicum]AGF54276.1 transcriptional regulator, HxlR family [Clostridium saccharoperbutylacetonicum N1-4(HMT)]AQR93193.1 putative HTH-type transcriptional regulator YybR [Clostridium saccharoperbutylacetonicum]NRT59208.1 DNA-binding HxlR family transcriptional regulator [Clostridium saccharoperbutylacetonicum]NSB28397.1 DNA-binding HxlR family transcriptional regulator [Clostridium saccharoperbutylacetonicum]NSB34610.1
MKEEVVDSDCQNIQCPVETTLNILSGKWKGIILYRLLGGRKRFNELKRLMPKVTHRTLTLQLRELERDGVIKRTVYAEVPPRVEYELTRIGDSMTPIIQAMYDWGINYQSEFKV